MDGRMQDNAGLANICSSEVIDDTRQRSIYSPRFDAFVLFKHISHRASLQASGNPCIAPLTSTYMSHIGVCIK